MAISEPVPLAHLLNRYRLAAGLTQEELAERAGVSARGVSDLERGIITKPRAYTVHQLAEALQLSPQDRALFEAAAYQWTVLPGDRPRGDHAQPVGSFLGALPPGPLVAREEEMERTRQLLEAASGGVGVATPAGRRAGGGEDTAGTGSHGRRAAARVPGSYRPLPWHP
jgi:transcriptional regulator with XRE-family HTH domain